MDRRSRRNHSPGWTAKIALAAVKGDRSLAERVEQCDAHPNQILEVTIFRSGSTILSIATRRSFFPKYNMKVMPVFFLRNSDWVTIFSRGPFIMFNLERGPYDYCDRKEDMRSSSL